MEGVTLLVLSYRLGGMASFELLYNVDSSMALVVRNLAPLSYERLGKFDIYCLLYEFTSLQP